MTSRQDEGIKKQEEMQEKLAEVGQDVEATLQDVGGVRNQVDDLQACVRYTNNGIYLLCGAVAEIMKVSGYKSNKLEGLKTYVRDRPPQLIDSGGLQIEDDPGVGLDSAAQGAMRSLASAPVPDQHIESVGLGQLRDNGTGGGIMYMKTASTRNL